MLLYCNVDVVHVVIPSVLLTQITGCDDRFTALQ